MRYDDSGSLISAELADDPAEVVQACYWRDAALHAATPYADYMRWHENELQRAS
jgi:hypothetical protein